MPWSRVGYVHEWYSPGVQQGAESFTYSLKLSRSSTVLLGAEWRYVSGTDLVYSKTEVWRVEVQAVRQQAVGAPL
jgi:hypothetical protein